jgi:hypothetical protein
MDDFFLGVCLLKYKKIDILGSSPELIPEILEHRHIVSSDVLRSVLSIEFSMYSCHLCLDTERICDQYRWCITEDETIDVTRETPSQYEEKISRKQKTCLWEIDLKKSRIGSIFSRNFFECCHLWHITRYMESCSIIHIDRVYNAWYEQEDLCVWEGVHSPSTRVMMW